MLEKTETGKKLISQVYPGLQVVVKRTIRIFADLNFHGNITRGNLTALCCTFKMIRGPETGNNPLKCKRGLNYMINALLDVMNYWMSSDWHRVASNWRLGSKTTLPSVTRAGNGGL